MDCRVVFLFCVTAVLALSISGVEGRSKKVVIHVPYKVKRIKHIHTIYKTVHHHHIDHAPLEEHEHFHHMHVHEEPPKGQHSQPVPGIGIPEFLPDVPDLPMDITDIPQISTHPHSRHPHPNIVPLYRRANGQKKLSE